ncbi:hypothetical protein JJB98_26065 [Bradyrhizobium diazoefficiens]|nr:hypothetical protein [Bradyrhizobium diazoefficiens]QQO23154.1 hypothetical protein JJB98_26065 [Bradyrhizobium diazoefficiens]
MLDKLKAAALWVWHWITVLVAMALGVLTVGIEYLDQLMGVDFTQVMSKERAGEIMFWTAVTKALVTAYNSQKAKT